MSVQAINNAVSDSYTMPAQALAPAAQEEPPPPPPPEEPPPPPEPVFEENGSSMESALPGSRQWQA